MNISWITNLLSSPRNIAPFIFWHIFLIYIEQYFLVLPFLYFNISCDSFVVSVCCFRGQAMVHVRCPPVRLRMWNVAWSSAVSGIRAFPSTPLCPLTPEKPSCLMTWEECRTQRVRGVWGCVFVLWQFLETTRKVITRMLFFSFFACSYKSRFYTVGLNGSHCLTFPFRANPG